MSKVLPQRLRQIAATLTSPGQVDTLLYAADLLTAEEQPAFTGPEPFGFLIEDPVFIGRHRVAVFVHDSVDAMHDWYRRNGRSVKQGGWEWEAVTSYRPTTESDAEVHLARERLYLSIVAHEATHVALLLYAATFLSSRRKARAWRHVAHHTEWMPELVGNLTAHILYGLKAHGFDVDPVD
jgi:hypothetical protein